ncbi:hypothetical protein ABPG75_009152 [Micractinium tetrahymenae]
MPRELITVSVGQAGNQIGSRFWELAVQEHAAANPDGVFDDAMGSFFQHVDAQGSPVGAAPPGAATAGAAAPPRPIQQLRARGVLVDMEEGVVDGMLRGPLGELFDRQRQAVTDVSGAGNNWAAGWASCGPAHHEQLVDALRAEASDSLQGFLLLHSLGGGTGSGVGSYILHMLEDEYPEALRCALSVLPDECTSDVVTAPYNALLSLARLQEHADWVLPVENQALAAACGAAAKAAAPGTAAARRPGADGGGEASPFGAMNKLAADLVLNLTASMRFGGQLNLDLGEIATNLVPFPRLHFLAPAMSPLAPPRAAGGRQGPAGAAGAAAGQRCVDQAFLDVLQPAHQLVKLHPKQTSLACALIVRGAAAAADLPRNIDRLRRSIRLPRWNPDGFKIAMCTRPPLGAPLSLLSLSNSCGLADTFTGLHARFQALYRRRLYTHHYEQHIELAELEAAGEAAAWLADSYRQLVDASRPPDPARLRGLQSDGGSFGQNSLRQVPGVAAVGGTAAAAVTTKRR